jgi:hypothetical protein
LRLQSDATSDGLAAILADGAGQGIYPLARARADDGIGADLRIGTRDGEADPRTAADHERSLAIEAEALLNVVHRLSFRGRSRPFAVPLSGKHIGL